MPVSSRNMSETEVKKKKKKTTSLFSKNYRRSSEEARSIREAALIRKRVSTLTESTDSHLCQRAPFNLSTRRNGVFLRLRGPLADGGAEKGAERKGGEERERKRKEKKERDPCGIGRVEYVKRITRSSRTESPDQLHNGATETDALQPPPRAPLALSRPKASPLSPPLPLSPSPLASSRSPFRKVTIEQRVEPLLCGRSNYYAL